MEPHSRNKPSYYQLKRAANWTKPRRNFPHILPSQLSPFSHHNWLHTTDCNMPATRHPRFTHSDPTHFYRSDYNSTFTPEVVSRMARLPLSHWKFAHVKKWVFTHVLLLLSQDASDSKGSLRCTENEGCNNEPVQSLHGEWRVQQWDGSINQ